ncbi:DciA family protein [Pseudidiomarina marina]|uniref:DciA family protein n=1 Tax=Pseudidiomarina marina TaxID=502366 RepID=UPI0038503CBA
MARKRPRDIQQLFGGQRLQRFTDFTEQYQRWQQQLQQCFVALQLSPLLAHCKVVSVRAHTLVLEVSSAALASRIKLQQSRIITYFQDESTGHISRIDVQVRPKISTPSLQPTEKAPQPVKNAGENDDETVAKLRRQAELCEEPLRSQLLALAEKYEKT